MKKSGITLQISEGNSLKIWLNKVVLMNTERICLNEKCKHYWNLSNVRKTQGCDLVAWTHPKKAARSKQEGCKIQQEELRKD